MKWKTKPQEVKAETDAVYTNTEAVRWLALGKMTRIGKKGSWANATISWSRVR